MNEQQRNGGRRHALEPRCMAERCRPCAKQALHGLGRQARDIRIVQVVGQPQRFLFRVPLNLALLSVDITLILGLNLQLQFYLFALLDADGFVPVTRANRRQPDDVPVSALRPP